MKQKIRITMAVEIEVDVVQSQEVFELCVVLADSTMKHFGPKYRQHLRTLLKRNGITGVDVS